MQVESTKKSPGTFSGTRLLGFAMTDPPSPHSTPGGSSGVMAEGKPASLIVNSAGGLTRDRIGQLKIRPARRRAQDRGPGQPGRPPPAPAASSPPDDRPPPRSPPWHRRGAPGRRRGRPDRLPPRRT